MPNSEKFVSHRKIICRHIKDSIIAHTLQPGDMINERRVAEQLGVSRTPVREAIQLLQDEGWLTVIPRKGTVVREPERGDMEEILQLRNMIALSSLEMGGHTVSPEEIAHFEELLARQEETMANEDAVAFMDACMELHLGIVRLARNKRLLEFAQDLCDNFHRMGIHTLIRTPLFTECVDGHGSIIRALAAGDVKGAEEAMARHILVTNEAMRGVM